MKYFLISIALMAGLVVVVVLTSRPAMSGELDTFAQCLARENLTMYGAEWCSHCQNEKRAFGSSFQFVPYVECPDEPKLCIEAGVRGYPTWITQDGAKFEGEQGLSQLAEISGCALPTSTYTTYD